MSRGPGRTMLALEAALTAEPETVWRLAAKVYSAEPTRAQIEAVRRAAKRLHALGRAEVRLRLRPGRTTTARWKRALTVRAPLSESEREQERRRGAAVLAKLGALLRGRVVRPAAGGTTSGRPGKEDAAE